MITDEERRKIAGRLRQSRNYDRCLPKSFMPLNDLFEKVKSCVRCDGGNVFDRLVDLIDAPERSTCHLMETDHEYEVSYRCSACKSVVWLDFKGNPRPDYCPKCGAKVVD